MPRLREARDFERAHGPVAELLCRTAGIHRVDADVADLVDVALALVAPGLAGPRLFVDALERRRVRGDPLDVTLARFELDDPLLNVAVGVLELGVLLADIVREG